MVRDGGFTVDQRVVYKVPALGKRVVDLEVRDGTGRLLWRIEAKTGKGRYSLWQRLKDAWLENRTECPPPLSGTSCDELWENL